MNILTTSYGKLVACFCSCFIKDSYNVKVINVMKVHLIMAIINHVDDLISGSTMGASHSPKTYQVKDFFTPIL